jgi:hypothetical protein
MFASRAPANRGRELLERIEQMGTQQMLYVALGVIIVGIAIAIGYALFSYQSTSSERDALANDLNTLAATAYQYRAALRTLGGGQGSFSGFIIPMRLKTNDNGTFDVIDAQANSITLNAVSVRNSTNSIRVTVKSDGKLDDWTYEGDFK